MIGPPADITGIKFQWKILNSSMLLSVDFFFRLTKTAATGGTFLVNPATFRRENSAFTKAITS